MSIQVKTYTGDTETLSRFITGTWLSSYGGKMVVPDWTAAYFDWQMTGPEYSDREYLLTAWDGERLVGSLLGMSFPLWYCGEEKIGCQGSWLSVDPEYRRHGVAKLMATEMDRRQRERGCVARLGYAFLRSRISLGPKFWKQQQLNTFRVKSCRLWARVIDPDAVQQWTNKTWEKWLIRLVPNRVVSIGQPHPSVNVRRYRSADLAACQELINRQARRAELAILWTPARLQRQLEYPQLAFTWVVERTGAVVGFMNYHLLGLTIEQKIEAAIVDLLACQQLTSREVMSLINRSLLEMQTAGVKIVLLREFYGQPAGSLLKTVFIPQFCESDLLLSLTDTPAPDFSSSYRKCHLLWR